MATRTTVIVDEVYNTLAEALRRTATTRWQGLRTGQDMARFARQALAAFAIAARSNPLSMRIEDIKAQHVAAAVRLWSSNGDSPATINKRLVCAGACGAPVKGHFVRASRATKWWLTPEAKARIIEFCNTRGTAGFVNLADYVEFVTASGLRVEEALRLTAGHVTGWTSPLGLSITVPGLKTVGSNATLPLTPEAEAVIRRRVTPLDDPSRKVFPVSYEALKKAWGVARSSIGAESCTGATLKALRRTAARHLHVDKGLPLDMVRQYLRHSDIDTTMGYLRLVGGYNEGEMRKYLSGAS